MTSHCRKLAVALVCALLLVPAATRVGQALHAARASSPVPSFTKSVDVPPEPVVIVPDQSFTLLDLQPLVQPVGLVVPVEHEAIPPLCVVADGDALRAPPVRAIA